MMRQPVGQPTGSAPAYERGGAAISGRTPNAEKRIAAGAEAGYVIIEDPCGAIKKDGTVCVASKVNNQNYCIGHLRGAKEKD
jgi:hypothetical protein